MLLSNQYNSKLESKYEEPTVNSLSPTSIHTLKVLYLYTAKMGKQNIDLFPKNTGEYWWDQKAKHIIEFTN